MAGRRRGHIVCESPDCRLLIAQIEGLPEGVRASHFATQRRLILERRERQARAEENASAVAGAEARVDGLILEAVRPDRKQGRVVTVAIPSGRTTVAPLPAERRARYRRHLERTIEQAATATDGAVSRDREDGTRRRAVASERFLAERSELATRTTQACATCGGGCCVAGGEHAFVSTVTIRRLLDADPSLEPEDVLDGYLSHLPDESIAGACVNQTARGCALPRAWRSDACNAYFCDALEAFQAGWDERTPPDAVLLIRRARTDGNRVDVPEASPVVEVAWVDEEGVRSVDRRQWTTRTSSMREGPEDIDSSARQG